MEKTDNDPTKDMKAKITYLSTKNRSLEEQVVLLQSQSGATSDLTKGLSVLQVLSLSFLVSFSLLFSCTMKCMY